jgi:hypothetical protein
VVCIRYTVLHVLLFKPVQMNHVDDNFFVFALSLFLLYNSKLYYREI